MGLVDKHMRTAQPHLGESEEAVTACQCQMKGTLAASAFGGLAGVLVARKRGEGKRDEATAAGFPLAQSMTIVVTNKRVLVLEGKKMLGAVEPSTIAAAVVVKRNAISPWTVRIDLADGTPITLEANRYTKPGNFVDAIQKLVAQSAGPGRARRAPNSKRPLRAR
jgi:hypothetical protein